MTVSFLFHNICVLLAVHQTHKNITLILLCLPGHLINMVVLILPLRHIVTLYLHILTGLLLYMGHQISKWDPLALLLQFLDVWGGFLFCFFRLNQLFWQKVSAIAMILLFFYSTMEKSWVSSHLFTFYFLFPSKEFLVFLKQSLAVALHAFLRFFKVCFWTSAALPLIFHSWYLTILRGMCLFVPPLNADVWIIQTFKKGTYGYCQSVIMGTLRISQYGVQCVLKKDEGTGQMMQ